MDGRTGTDARIDKTKTQGTNTWTDGTDRRTEGRMDGCTDRQADRRPRDTQKDKKADEAYRLID